MVKSVSSQVSSAQMAVLTLSVCRTQPLKADFEHCEMGYFHILFEKTKFKKMIVLYNIKFLIPAIKEFQERKVGILSCMSLNFIIKAWASLELSLRVLVIITLNKSKIIHQKCKGSYIKKLFTS